MVVACFSVSLGKMRGWDTRLLVIDSMDRRYNSCMGGVGLYLRRRTGRPTLERFARSLYYLILMYLPTSIAAHQLQRGRFVRCVGHSHRPSSMGSMSLLGCCCVVSPLGRQHPITAVQWID